MLSIKKSKGCFYCRGYRIEECNYCNSNIKDTYSFCGAKRRKNKVKKWYFLFIIFILISVIFSLFNSANANAMIVNDPGLMVKAMTQINHQVENIAKLQEQIDLYKQQITQLQEQYNQLQTVTDKISEGDITPDMIEDMLANFRQCDFGVSKIAYYSLPTLTFNICGSGGGGSGGENKVIKKAAETLLDKFSVHPKDSLQEKQLKNKNYNKEVADKWSTDLAVTGAILTSGKEAQLKNFTKIAKLMKDHSLANLMYVNNQIELARWKNDLERNELLARMLQLQAFDHVGATDSNDEK